MKRGIFLSGYGCEPWIWDRVKEKLGDDYVIDIIEWPKELIGTFNKVQDFADWTISRYSKLDISLDFIVGHSMGGIIALYIASSKKVQVNKVVLMESFITSPGKFFQNLTYDNKSLNLKITEMIKNEVQYYAPEINSELRCLDVTKLIYNSKCNIYGIYGDRGCGNKEKVVSELFYSKDVEKRVKIDIIRGSCHFPMLENEKEVVDYLKHIL